MSEERWIFISCAQEDRRELEPFLTQLRAESQRYSIFSGVKWHLSSQYGGAEEREILGRAEIFMAITSPNYANSGTCKQQIQSFIGQYPGRRQPPLEQLLYPVFEVEIYPLNEEQIPLLEPLRSKRPGQSHRCFELRNQAPQISCDPFALQKLCQELEKRLTELEQDRQAWIPIQRQLENASRFVFVTATLSDKAVARQIRDQLRHQGVECTLPITLTENESGTLTPEQIYSNLKSNLQGCQALILVAVDRTRCQPWFTYLYSEYRKYAKKDCKLYLCSPDSAPVDNIVDNIKVILLSYTSNCNLHLVLEADQP